MKFPVFSDIETDGLKYLISFNSNKSSYRYTPTFLDGIYNGFNFTIDSFNMYPFVIIKKPYRWCSMHFQYIVNIHVRMCRLKMNKSLYYDLVNKLREILKLHRIIQRFEFHTKCLPRI